MKRVFKIIGLLVGLLAVLVVVLAAYIYLSAIAPSRPVGFTQVIATDPGHPQIPVAVWYPTTAKPGFVLLGMRGMRVASNGPIAGRGLPLVVITHGTGASGISHADTAIALAENGIVVAAITHPGDNFRDGSDVGKPDWLVNRVRHVERTIDWMLGKWSGAAHLNPVKIGVFGYSAGATTALIAIGGKPDLARIATHCAQHPEFVCKLTSPEAYRTAKPTAWQGDPRIRAAVIAAPGLGFTFEPNGLSGVRAAVQLWSGIADQTVPYATNAGVVRQLLPVAPEEHRVPGATHYAFLTPCGLLGPPQLCRDNSGFDREDFHKSFNQSMVRFFTTQLAQPSTTTR